jgi:hypothetical protein
MLKSARDLPANRESELRDAMTLAHAGFSVLANREGVTLAELNAYQRNRDWLISAAHDRYRGALA